MINQMIIDQYKQFATCRYSLLRLSLAWSSCMFVKLTKGWYVLLRIVQSLFLQTKLVHRLRIIFFIISLLIPLSGFSQTKKTLSQAKQWIKEGKSLDKAENSLMALLKDSDNKDNEKIWTTLFDALRKQYEQGNEKLYLKQKVDTAKLFNVASRMFTVMEAFDSIDARPNKKGIIAPKFRKSNCEFLDRLRPNLFHGGLFFINKQKWTEAYDYFNLYIDAANQPLFVSKKYIETDRRLPVAAYWAVYSAFKMKDPQKVFHHTYMALKDTAHYKLMLQYLAETYHQENDTARYLNALKEGFQLYPNSKYFFNNLIAYYSQKKDWDQALQVVDSALKKDSSNVTFRLTKSSVLLNRGDYEQAFQLATILLINNDSLPEANLNAGLAKFNQGVMLDKSSLQSAQLSKKVIACYRQALPYLEKFRRLAPNQQNKWALPLYTIYLNLNMGKEFDEIDKIIKSMK